MDGDLHVRLTPNDQCTRRSLKALRWSAMRVQLTAAGFRQRPRSPGGDFSALAGFQPSPVSAEIVQESVDTLSAYALVPSAFDVTAVMDISRQGDRLALCERVVATPFIKDYDAVQGNGPLDWPQHFDVSKAAFFVARKNGVRVGGAVAVLGPPDVAMLGRHDDLALLWDIRVIPDRRRKGVGSALLASVEHWVSSRGGTCLKVETQNINVPACRFYARHGFTLADVREDAYPELPGEIQLFWSKELAAFPAGTG